MRATLFLTLSVLLLAGLFAAGTADNGCAEVKIDIKPGSYPNSINLKSNGTVPVALLTCCRFHAGLVDPDTVLFAGAEPVSWEMCDADYDGDQDLVFHFRNQDLDLDENSTQATLSGYTVYGAYFEGTDSVRIVHGRK